MPPLPRHSRLWPLLVLALLVPAPAPAEPASSIDYRALAAKIQRARGVSLPGSVKIDYLDLAVRIRRANPRRHAEHMLQAALAPDPLLGLPTDPETVKRAVRTLRRISGRPVQQTRMKAFERLVAARAPSQPLLDKDLYFVADLHLIPTMKDLFESVLDSGLPVARMILKGVRHSQTGSVMDELSSSGIRVLPAASGASEEEYRGIVRRIVEIAKRNPRARFLVGGHGGKLHALLTRALDEPGTPADLASRVAIGETTHRGEKLMSELRGALRAAGAPPEKLRERFPVVDIGAHWAKLGLESPVIGLGCANAMHSELRDLARRGLTGLDLRSERVPVLLVGYGAVGRETARMLRRLGYDVHVTDRLLADPQSPMWTAARAAGVTPHRSLEEALRTRVKVVAAATGEKPFDAASRAALRAGTVVFNLASPGEVDALLQLPAPPTRGHTVPFLGRDLPLRARPVDHQDAVRLVGDKPILVARGGQVINLALGATEPPEYIQLTRGLTAMLLWRLAEVLGRPPGRYGLDDRAVRSFVADVQSDLRSAGLGPLEDPTYPTRL